MTLETQNEVKGQVREKGFLASKINCKYFQLERGSNATHIHINVLFTATSCLGPLNAEIYV